MNRFTKVFVLMFGITLLCLSSYCANAQENTPAAKAYIYCTAYFRGTRVDNEEKINNYTQKTKVWEYTMRVDCRQYDKNIKGVRTLVTDENGNETIFPSPIAGLNWLGMMGWELIPYPQAYDTDGFIPEEYWLRLDVTGLTIDEINQKLSVFNNCR